jgi:hypothetical protein
VEEEELVEETQDQVVDLDSIRCLTDAQASEILRQNGAVENDLWTDDRSSRSWTEPGAAQAIDAAPPLPDLSITSEKLQELLLEEGTDGVIQYLTVCLDPALSAALSSPSPTSAAEWHALVRACAQLSNGQKASLYNALLAVVAPRDMAEARQVLNTMQAAAGITPDVVSFSVCTSAALGHGDLVLAKNLLQVTLDPRP